MSTDQSQIKCTKCRKWITRSQVYNESLCQDCADEVADPTEQNQPPVPEDEESDLVPEAQPSQYPDPETLTSPE